MNRRRRNCGLAGDRCLPSDRRVVGRLLEAFALAARLWARDVSAAGDRPLANGPFAPEPLAFEPLALLVAARWLGADRRVAALLLCLCSPTLSSMRHKTA